MRAVLEPRAIARRNNTERVEVGVGSVVVHLDVLHVGGALHSIHGVHTPNKCEQVGAVLHPGRVRLEVNL